MGTTLGVVGLACAISAEFARRRDARRSAARERLSDVRANRAERQLRAITGQLQLVLRSMGAKLPEDMHELLAEASEERRWSMGMADVNHDGQPEMLIASPAGAHSTRLQIFGQASEWPDSFGKLAELYSITPAGFTVGDLDGDGLIEIATLEQIGDHPYAAGITEEILSRWDGEEFAQVDSSPRPKPGEPGFDDPVGTMRWVDVTAVLSMQ